jgi:hypothetical protein
MLWDFSMIGSFGRLAVAELQCGVNGRLNDRNPIGRRSTSNETCKFPPHHVPRTMEFNHQNKVFWKRQKPTSGRDFFPTTSEMGH